MNTNITQPKLTPTILWLMTIASGLVVANNYYNQPLLGLMAKDLGVSESKISNVTMLTQIGYACGLFFFIPLGDMFKRKKMILIDFLFIIIALFITATSNSIEILLPISFVIGFTSVIPQLFIPMAASLAEPKDKAKSVGIVVSGLLVGILGSRVISGYIGELWGWRELYYLAAGIMIILFILIYLKLPEVHPNFHGSYKDLLSSLGHLFKSDPALRLAALRGGLSFASLSAFWTPLVFFLEKEYHLSSGEASSVAGNLGFAGIAGAVTAAFAGRLVNKYNKSMLISVFAILVIISWVIFYFSGTSYIILIVGVILIDIGVQAGHITNQSIIFTQHPNATNRVNTIYMTAYFIGGSIGTWAASYTIEFYGWGYVSLLGGILGVILLVSHWFFSKKQDYLAE